MPQIEQTRPLRRSLFRIAKSFRPIALALAAVMVSTTIAVSAPTSASAVEYPSWADVESARADTNTKAQQIDRIRSLISQLDADSAAARSVAQQMAQEYEIAQGAADEANSTSETLAAKADTAAAMAKASTTQVGQLAAALARNSGEDITLKLLLDSSEADDLVYNLASIRKVTESNNQIYEAAVADRNTAQALTDQAVVAAEAREKLASEAESALERATVATAAAEAALLEQQNNQDVLQAQLVVLTEDRAATEADYAQGEKVRLDREAAAAAAAASARAAAAAAAATSRGSRAPAPAPTDIGQLSAQGWASPLGGRISSPFGPRPQRPAAGVGPFHYGTDIPGACGATVRAATAGTVVYSAPLGTFGNWLLIDHGNGVQTGYAHNLDGGLLVGVGQRVSAGQPVALVGDTGASAGCHSHFEVRTNGTRIDPVPFMANRGVILG